MFDKEEVDSVSLEKHYHHHYLISYSFMAKNNTFGFGELCIDSEMKINNKDIDLLRKEVLRNARQHNEDITNTSIISIFDLGCSCEEEIEEEINV